MVDTKPVIINAVGDVSFARDIGKFIRLKKNKNYDYPLSYVKPHLEKADLTLMNLETTIAPRLNYLSPAFKNKKPNFSSHNASLKSLINNGVDVVNLANNHMNDFGSTGLKKTVNLVSKSGLTYVGTKDNKYEIIVKKGIKIGILGVTRNFFKVNKSDIHYYNVNQYNNLLNQVKLLKKKCDLIIV